MSEPGLDIILAFILWFIAVVLTVLANEIFNVLRVL